MIDVSRRAYCTPAACKRRLLASGIRWRVFVARSATSAGRCNPATSLRIMVRLKGRCPLKTSETLLLLPIYGILARESRLLHAKQQGRNRVGQIDRVCRVLVSL